MGVRVCERRIEFFVKIQKKYFGGGVRGGGMGCRLRGGGQGGCERNLGGRGAG